MDWYAGDTTLHIVGQLLIAVPYVGTGLVNAMFKVKQHVDRMVAMNIPFAGPVLWLGFTLQFIGGTLVAIDYRADIGAIILIVFTIVASAMFHRFWLVEDPLRRHFHVSFLFVNCGLIGALVTLI